MKRRTKAAISAIVVLAVAIGIAGAVAYRAMRLASIGWDFVDNLRYQLETGEDIADTSAGEALAVNYLENIFGDNEELLGKLKGVVQRGLEDDQALKLGEVSAMVVTYRRNEEGLVFDVVAHVLGGFPMGKRKPGFHRDGYFRHLVDRDIWNLGNAMIGILGRDMILFAEQDVAEQHQRILESIFTYGDITPLVESIDGPMYYTAVFPDPKKVVPRQLRQHVQAVVLKGYLSPTDGRAEMVLLTPSMRSASYTLSVLSDIKRLGEVALRTKWKGVVHEKSWGAKVIDPWWAYEMVQTSTRTEFEKQFNVVRVKSEFSRVMVNAAMKSIERMGRDLAQTRASLEERLDPRLVDERLFAKKPGHYWSESHRWGSNWPFPDPDAPNFDQAAGQVVADWGPDNETTPAAAPASSQL